MQRHSRLACWSDGGRGRPVVRRRRSRRPLLASQLRGLRRAWAPQRARRRTRCGRRLGRHRGDDRRPRRAARHRARFGCTRRSRRPVERDDRPSRSQPDGNGRRRLTPPRTPSPRPRAVRRSPPRSAHACSSRPRPGCYSRSRHSFGRVPRSQSTRPAASPARSRSSVAHMRSRRHVHTAHRRTPSRPGTRNGGSEGWATTRRSRVRAPTTSTPAKKKRCRAARRRVGR